MDSRKVSRSAPLAEQLHGWLDPISRCHQNEVMPTLADAAASELAPKRASTPPDWGRVHFPLGCARCGHDLRGLSDPQCPACGLDFDWHDAAPLEELTCRTCGYHLFGLSEARCPECGEGFVWSERLDDHRRRSKPLFEYHYRWRDRPIRTLIRNWRLAMRPWKLWRTIDIHDPPSTRGLLYLLAVFVAVFVFCFQILAVLTNFVYLLVWWFAPQGRAGLPVWWGVGRMRLSDYAEVVLGGYGQLPGSRTSWTSAPWALGFGWWYASYLVVLAAWAVAGFGALLLLRQSMAQCRVRNGHVLRALVYSMLPLAPAQIAWGLALFLIDLGRLLTPGFNSLWHFAGPLLQAAPMLVVPWTVMSIALAYRLYIQMRHAWAVAITTQGIALLVALTTGSIEVAIRTW